MSHAGAHFRKSDFQIHSPRDHQWQGARPEGLALQRGNPSRQEIQHLRMEWAINFLRLCSAKKLQAIAITDHHEGIYLWDVIRAQDQIRAHDETFDMWILPGMEVTTKDSAQALIIFDADLTQILFEKARSLLRLPSDCKESHSRGIEVEPLGIHIEELQVTLNSDDELRDRFIVLPNVTPEGYKTVLRKGFHKRFKEMPYVGGYLDRQVPDDLKDRERKILDGAIPAWGSTRRGVIATSDAREEDFRNVGSYPTWIKLAAPTAESLRQAMLAADSRIRYTDPTAPNVFIEGVKIVGATFLDIPHLALNPQYNAIIGGRGAGKSTLLEFIRFALGQSAMDTPSNDWDPTHSRRRDLLEQALSPTTGKVDIVVNMDGAIIKLSRGRVTSDQIQMEVGATLSVLPPRDVRSMFAVQTFSQGELSHLGQDTAEARLMELVTEPDREIFENTAQQIKQAAEEIAAQLNRRVSAWGLEQRKRRTEAELVTTYARLDALRGALSGSDPAATAIVQSSAQFEEADEFFRNADEQASELLSGLNSALARASDGIARVQGQPSALDTPEIAVARRALSEVQHRLGKVRQYLSAAEERFGTSMRSADEAWRPKYMSHREDYQRAVEKLSTHQVTADQIQNLGSQVSDLKAESEVIDAQLRDLHDADVKFAEAVDSHQRWQENRIQQTRESAASVEDLSQGLAKAEVAPKGDFREIHDALISLFQGTSVREARLNDLLGILEESNNPLQSWAKLLDEILAILRWNVSGRKEVEARPHTPILLDAVGDASLARFCERLTTERVISALKAEIHPRLRITHQRHGRSVEFRQASQGERAATLLSILMRQEGGPLLIDQPEEDLDNRIINEIISSVRDAKDKRQLIFATHNANLVVNGDAELVVDLAVGTVSCSGAIDQVEVRDAITTTMEGGKDAFELRRKKYNF
jgi:type III restriction enzyme